MTVLIIVLGIVGSIGLYCFFDYKKQELEYKRVMDENISKVTDYSSKVEAERLKLETEKEKARIREIECAKQLEIEKEKTRQLEIKAEYREKHKTDGCSVYYEEEMGKKVFLTREEAEQLKGGAE